MKSLRLIILLVVATLVSCEKEEIANDKNGKVEFGLIISEEGARLDQDNARYVVVSINDENGEAVLIHEKIELLNLQGYYLTAPISLKIGSYSLEDFLILDDNSNVIYATPKEGSDKAPYVVDPLPIHFEVRHDEVTKVVPQVISTSLSNPEQFGYVTFSFEIVSTNELMLAVFIYNESIKNFELTSGRLEILQDDNVITSNELRALTNTVPIPDPFEGEYRLIVKKEGYQEFNQTYSAESLSQYLIGENGPLIIILQKGANLPDGLFYGVGFNQENKIVFGSIDYYGNETIIKELNYSSIYGGYSSTTNDYYVFGTENKTIIVDKLGEVINVIEAGKISAGSLEYSSSNNKYYGLGFVENQLIYGSVDNEGNEIEITALSNFNSYYGSYSNFDHLNNRYIFGRTNSLILVDTNGSVVSTIPTQTFQIVEVVPEKGLFYGVGFLEPGKMVFGSVDYEGNENVIAELPYSSYYSAFSSFDKENNLFLFGTGNKLVAINLEGIIVAEIIPEHLSVSQLERIY